MDVAESAWSADDGAWREAGYRSGAALPVFWGTELLGVVALASVMPAVATRPDERRLFEMAARQAAALISGEHWRHEWAESDRNLSDEREQALVVQAAIRALQDSAGIHAHSNEIAKAIQALGWGHVMIALRDETGALQIELSAGAKHGADELADLDAIFGQCLQESFESDQAGGLIFMPAGDSADPHWQEGDRLCAPLRIRQRDPIGVLSVSAPADGLRPAEGRLRVLNILASLLAYTVENTRLLAETSATAETLAEQVDELSMIHRADRELSSSLDVDRVIKLTIDWAMRRTGADSGIVALMADGQRGLIPFVTLGYVDPEVLRYSEQNPWPLEKSIMGQVAKTGQTIILSQIERRDRRCAFHLVSDPLATVGSALDAGEILGVLALASAASDAFNGTMPAFWSDWRGARPWRWTMPGCSGSQSNWPMIWRCCTPPAGRSRRRSITTRCCGGSPSRWRSPWSVRAR